MVSHKAAPLSTMKIRDQWRQFIGPDGHRRGNRTFPISPSQSDEFAIDFAGALDYLDRPTVSVFTGFGERDIAPGALQDRITETPLHTPYMRSDERLRHSELTAAWGTLPNSTNVQKSSSL